jgi:glycosyltransferase involved in cell wall biosynthesis
VIDNGVVIGEVLADRYRPDLEAAGIGSGRHAFELVVPGGLSPYERHVIEVRRSEDGALLAGSPHVLAAAAMATVALAASSPARGRLDVVTRERITGWAQNAEDPATPVALQILANGRPIARVLANQYRPDLAAAGIGTGWHSFDVAIPGGLSPLTRQVIQVRQERDGAELPGSPSVIEAAESFDSVVEQAVARAVAAVGSQDERERVLSFIAAQADRLLQQQADGETGRLSRNAQRRLAPGLRALVIDERVPVAGRDAGSQAVLSHMQALQRLGYAVSFIAAEQMTAPAGGLEAIGVQPCRAPFYASVEDVLRRQADGIDLVYLHRAQIASRYLGLVRAYAPRARVIYSVADLHHVRLERQAAVEDRPDLLGESRRLRLEECRAAWAADAVITHSAVEAALLRQAVPEANVHVVGWDLKVRPTRVPAAAREGLAFIGNYAHQPNADAARWLVEAVMPLVWRADPSITCRLVGGGMTEPVRQLAGARVEVVGHVADLSTGVFDRVRLTVAPLRFGAGLKGKVLESFAAGVPCVMSPVAAEGLPTELQALVGADAAELAALIIRVHRDAECADAADAGLAWVANAFSAASVTRGLQAAVSGAHSVDRRIQPGKVAG